mgnify:CR=1 FL=1
MTARFQGNIKRTSPGCLSCSPQSMYFSMGCAGSLVVAFTDNPASIRVSQKVGYKENGLDWKHPRDERGTLQRMLLLPEDLIRGEPITVSGAAALRRFVGIEPSPSQP